MLGGDTRKIDEEIKEIVIKTIMSIQPNVQHIYKTCQPTNKENDICFEILGFDILIDEKFKPWLLEVNHAPSFNTDTEVDQQVKWKVLYDTFKLIHISIKKKRR